jgi:hypothetical protein
LDGGGASNASDDTICVLGSDKAEDEAEGDDMLR